MVVIIAVAATVAACGPEPDQALYHQAHERAVAGRDAESEALYRQLLREHPGSRLSAEAHLALAELLFRRGDHEAALAQYRELARRYPAAKSRGYALYKQAWCLLHLDQPRQAMTAFERVIALESDAGLPAEQRRGLVHEARRDLVKAFARAGDPWPAPPATYFARWGGPIRHRMLDALADLSFERGRYAEAAALYRELIASQVDSPRLCAWQRGHRARRHHDGDARRAGGGGAAPGRGAGPAGAGSPRPRGRARRLPGGCATR